MYGITIDTLDNPGWRVRLDLAYTDSSSPTLQLSKLSHPQGVSHIVGELESYLRAERVEQQVWGYNTPKPRLGAAWQARSREVMEGRVREHRNSHQRTHPRDADYGQVIG